jgi:hypothetical protein
MLPFAYFALWLIWNLVISPINALLEEGQLKKLEDAERMLFHMEMDAIHQKNIEELRELLPPHQFRQLNTR